MKKLTKNKIYSAIFALEDERDNILSKMAFICKEDQERLKEIEDKLDEYTSLLDKDGAE